MSYGSTPKSGQRTSRGGGGMMFLIIIAIGAFLLFRNNGSNDSPPQPAAGPEEVLGSKDYPSDKSANHDIGGGGDFEARPMPSSGQQSQSSDWDLEEVETKSTRAVAKPNLKNPASKTTAGDWSIEEVDKRSGSQQKSDNQFQFSNPGSKSDTLPAAKTGGDWSIEDAGGETSKKKTVNGDWSIEDGKE